MYPYPMRRAIAMVELIFALVIIGIVLLPVPNLINISTKSGFVAVQQEAINEAATRMNLILSYPWDENNTDELYIPPILYVTNGAPALQPSGSTGRRAGTPDTAYRSFIRSDSKTFYASPIGSDGGDSDDMDDFNGVSNLISIETAVADYIETTTIQIQSTVTYGDDNCSGGTYTNPGGDKKIVFSPNLSSTAIPTTNIKFITVNLTSSSAEKDLDKNITLHAFSANIGGFDLEERIY